MKKLIGFILMLGMAATTYAVPTLQVGAPAGSGDSGAYADYQLFLTNPTETDTAVTYGNTIFVAGAFGPKDLFIGGQYTDPANPLITLGIAPGTQGSDWTDFTGPAPDKTPFLSDFSGRGAILLASVPDGSSGSLTIDLGLGDISPFFTSDDMSFFPNEHDPVKAEISDFLFFDIGSFAEIEAVPDFCESGEPGCGSSGSGSGQIKTVKFQLTGYDWVHFDAMALVAYAKSSGKSTRVITSEYRLDNNPGSHDVIWEDGHDVPEPGTLLLLGSGLIGLAFYGRRKFNKKI